MEVSDEGGQIDWDKGEGNDDRSSITYACVCVEKEEGLIDGYRWGTDNSASEVSFH